MEGFSRRDAGAAARDFLLRTLAVTSAAEVLVTGILHVLGIVTLDRLRDALLAAALLAGISAPLLYVWVAREWARNLTAQGVLELVQGLDAVVWEADATTLAFTFVSRRAEELLGYPVERWLAQPDFWTALVHPDDREQVVALYRSVSEHGSPRALEYRALAADGRVVWVRNAVRAVWDGRGRVQRLRGLMLDVTEQKQAEAERRDFSEKMRVLMEAMPDAVYFKDGSGRWLLVNSAGLRLFELEGVPYQGKTEHELAEVRPFYREALLGCVQTDERAWQQGTTSVNEESVRRPDGTTVTLETIKVPLFHADGSRKGLVVVGRDITERKKAEETRRQLAAILEATTDLVATTDVQGRVLYLNTAGRRMLGIPPDDDVSRLHLRDIHSRWAREVIMDLGVRAAARDGVWHGETALVSADGQEIPVSEVILAHRSADGRIEFFSTVARDISERKRYERQIVYLAERDPLTDLFNRRRFQEELRRELARARRYGTRGALLFLDLDDFKEVNDSLGHAAGDRLLRNVAGLLRRRLRQTDTLARLGGDEFAILLPHTDGPRAQVVARQILEAVSQHTFRVDRHPVRITLSIGVALYPDHGTTAERLLASADLAMYQAKEDGRNGVFVYSRGGPGQAEIELRFNWKRRLREALEKDRFLLYCQPILDLRTGRISRYELLVRMKGEEGEVVLPGAFLPVAERFGLIHAIDRWVVRQAIHLIAEQRRVGRELCLEVNLSAKAFSDGELLPMIQRELADTAIDPATLVFEITETAAVTDVDQARRFIERLKELGCQFALDDFGVGFSSFYHLKHLPVDYLKIDGSFIRNLPRDPADEHLVKAMVRVAHALGKQVIAEFVSDEETAQLLRKFGADYAQGFYIGRPLPVAEALSG